MLVNVGDEKGALLDAAVRHVEPKRVLELGTYCGYSALRIARAAPQFQVYSVELSPRTAQVAQRIWAHAGVDDRIICVDGTIGDVARPSTAATCVSSRARCGTPPSTRPTSNTRH
jgi:catechol O-methyltransferase